MAATSLLVVPPAALTAIRVVHYVYPPALFVWFLASQAAAVCTLANLRAPRKAHRKRLFVFLQLTIIASYVGEAVLQCVRTLTETGWWSSADNVIYLLTSIVVWGFLELAIVDTQKPVWYPYYGSWLISVIAETCLLSLSISANAAPNKFEIGRFGIQGLRMLMFAAVPLGVWAVRDKDMDMEGHESERLLGAEPVQPSAYGTAPEDNSVREARAVHARMMKKIEESGSWWTYAKSFSIFWQYVWPKGESWLQFSMGLVGLCLLVERVLNVMVPHQLGVVTNALMEGSGRVPWSPLTLFVLYRWLDSGSGVQALQSYLWMPIDQYTHRSLTVAAYNHVMSLSYDFHSNKKTGEVWSSVAQGRSVNGFIESILFQVAPMLVDLCIAFAYFFWAFDAYMALIVAVVSVVYLWATFKLTAIRTNLRRELNTTGRNEVQIMIETVSSWSTVSYFNRIPYEQSRYLGAMRLFQKAERKWLIGLSVLNVSQSLIFTVGLLCASFLAVYEVSKGTQPVGSFVTLLSYWAQLAGPLSFFANFYRKVQTQMLDAEKLLALFQEKPTIADEPRAIALKKVEGIVDFENVCFSYDSRKPAITDVSFHVPAGTTVAFVGETGGGKTTCLKLLFRFYDVASGAIKIDGYDIRDIKLSCLRDHMGVVPQDPQLFNDTIMNNLRYANFDATDEEIYEACRAASIHEKILSFPDGYLSQVGERGIKLSGGEMQRVAIARAILKNPKIILLDEATSMIDMETERQIQEAFKKLAKDRTMFVVAHRLSTIMNADLIIVIKNGQIVEKGGHEELLATGGMYHQLWSRQLKPAVAPPPTPKGVPLVEDLIGSLNSNDAAKFANPSVQRIEIPEASKRSPQPTVTFSLPERTVWGPQPQLQPALNPMNPRIAAPSHGILKNAPAVKAPAMSLAVISPAPKSATLLKPNAKEFIPRNITSATPVPVQSAQKTAKVRITAPEPPVTIEAPIPTPPVVQPSSEGVVEEAKETDSSRSGTVLEKTSLEALEIVPKETSANASKMEAQLETRNLETQATGEVNIPAIGGESGGEDTTTADLDADSPQEFKKRRRRIRRRNSKSKTTEKDDSTETKPMDTIQDRVEAHSASPIPVAQPAVSAPSTAVTLSAKENDHPRAANSENASSTSGSIGKNKRRFRNSYKTKSNSGESGAEGGPLTAIRPVDNIAGPLRPRAGSFASNNANSLGKEDQPPTKRSDLVSSATKQQATQQSRNSGGLRRTSVDKGQNKLRNNGENENVKNAMS